MILASFDVQVAPILPIKFPVSWPFGSGEEEQNRFSRRQPSWNPIRTILATFNLQVAPIFPTKIWVNWPFCSGQEAQIRFSRAWISNPNNFNCFFVNKLPWYFLTNFESTGILVQEKKHKIYFQNGGHGATLDYLQNNFNFLWSTSPWYFLPSFESIGLSVQEKLKIYFQGDSHEGHLGFQGPVVQSVVSLTSSLRVISLTVLEDSIHNILIFFAEKMWVAFALQKLLTFFQQKISAYLRITWCKF